MSVVVITGGNSGFGLAGVRAFVGNGDTVIATVRNQQRSDELLAQLNSEGLLAAIKVLELSNTASFSCLIDELVDEFGRIDVLINNAGILKPGAFEDLTDSEVRTVMETNFFAPMFLSRCVLPVMRAQGSGQIIMVSSLSGVAGLAGDAFYAASKFALEGATEALRHEVDRWGVKVALIEAAQHATAIFNTANNTETLLPENYPVDSPYRTLIETKLQEIADGMLNARDPQIVGDLMLEIAQSDSTQLRWQADEQAEMVVSTMHGQSDGERDAFLRVVSDIDWWSSGKACKEDH
ncbi:MAG: SDR family NAD(P)-dependent oxidoreductase [Pseudomonadota bacterium]